MGFDKRDNARKYTPQEGDTLEKIAERESAAGNPLTWQELAKFNWGTDDADETNAFLRDELGCRLRDEDNNFVISAEDESQGELLIPVRFRKPGLALDTQHKLRVRKKPAPPKQFVECARISGVHFETNKSFIRPSVVDDLQKVDDALARNPDAKVMTFGHTDAVGSGSEEANLQYNKDLSERRARSTYAFITNDAAIWEELYNRERWGTLAIQRILKDFGGPFDPGPVDGIEGPRTKQAIRNYQGARGLTVDGVAGPNTRNVMFTEYMTGKHDVEATPERFMDPKHMGCSWYNRVDPTAAPSEANRRVSFFLFHPDRLPNLPCAAGSRAPCKKQSAEPLPRNRESFRCSFYDSIAKKCPGEGPVVPVIPGEKRNEVEPAIQTEPSKGPVAPAMAFSEEGGQVHVAPVQSKVVILDRNLARHQASGEKPIRPDPTCITVYVEQSNKKHPYKKGGKLKCAPVNVDVFQDPECKKPLEGDLSKGIPLTNEQLTGPQRLKLYLRGKTKGRFELTLELEDPEDPLVEVKGPAKAKMGVAELVMKLFHHDHGALAGIKVDPTKDDYLDQLKAKKLPDQKEMSDPEKVKTGRVLHKQYAGNFGRAKLVLNKLDENQWPEGCDDYELILTEQKASGGLAFYDASVEGKKLDAVRIKKKDLKEDKVFWVEGTTTTRKVRDLTLSLGLAPAGGEGGGVLRNGDFARFTIVEIKEVKLAVKTGANKAVVWDGAKHRFFINTDTDARGELEGRELKDKSAKGKEIKVTAQLTEKIEGVRIHFMLVGDADNREKSHWGNDLAASFSYWKIDQKLKAKDKSDPKNLLHISSKTNADGLAETQQLVLSRLGGETFTLGAYINEDPHLAKYVDGHADLSKRKPVLSTGPIEIWRRLWVQNTYNKNTPLPSRNASDTIFQGLQLEYHEIDEAKIDVSTISGLVEHPRWQFDPGAGSDKVICVGSHNKTNFLGEFKAPTENHTPKAHLIMCDVQWDDTVGPSQRNAISSRTAFIRYKNSAGNEYLGVFDPPLKGSKIVRSGSWTWNDGTRTHRGDLTDTEVRVVNTRTHTSAVKVTLPARCAAGCPCGGGTAINPNGTRKARVTLRMNAATGPWAGESMRGSEHCLIVIDTDNNCFNNTITHEIGHKFSQVRTTKNWHGIPDHPDEYEERGGQGEHCKKDATEHATRVDKYGKKIYVGGTCIMFHVARGNTSFCDNCKTDLRVRDLSAFFK